MFEIFFAAFIQAQFVQTSDALVRQAFQDRSRACAQLANRVREDERQQVYDDCMKR